RRRISAQSSMSGYTPASCRTAKDHRRDLHRTAGAIWERYTSGSAVGTLAGAALLVRRLHPKRRLKQQSWIETGRKMLRRVGNGAILSPEPYALSGEFSSLPISRQQFSRDPDSLTGFDPGSAHRGLSRQYSHECPWGRCWPSRTKSLHAGQTVLSRHFQGPKRDE